MLPRFELKNGCSVRCPQRTPGDLEIAIPC